jgi:nicotinamidase-related amidase
VPDVPTLAHLVDPTHTAVVTMEMERGVVGDLATIEDLAKVVRQSGTIDAVASLVHGARTAGARVVHCVAEWRADRAGTALNTPLAASLSGNSRQILQGTPATELVSPLGPEPEDLISRRTHGLTPFTGTDLDALLRNCGIRTVIATGVSLNVGVLGLCLSAADLGYRIVVPTDAVAGVPQHYGAEVLHHTIAMVASLTTTEEIIAAWRMGAQSS